MQPENLLVSLAGAVQANLNKIAVEYGQRKITYQELDICANRIANFFAGKNLSNPNIVLLLERSPELVASLMGILKSGGIFVPLDLRNPENRLRLMLQEVDADWVMVQSKDYGKLKDIVTGLDKSINALILDGGEVEPAANISIHRLPEDIPTEFTVGEINKHCYIYFTSGSTGTPKGILGRTKSVQHFIEWERREFGIDDSFKVSQLTSPAFDASLRDIFVPLVSGGTLCIPASDEVLLNPEKLIRWINESGVNLIHTTPSLFRSIFREVEDGRTFAQLKYILLAGEMLRGQDVQKFFELFQGRIELVNLYGPSETTMIKLFYRVQETDAYRINIPVGKPIDKTEAVILDANLKPCRVGTVGEVYIRTPFCSSGYYNRPEKTREVFIPNPFTNNPNDIVYKTGDLGRMMPDGNMELIGRIDDQIKIRGIRVEPGDIENHLLNYPVITEALVMARDDKSGEKYLCAYYVASEEIPVGTLRQYLGAHLPEAMIPAYYVKLDTIPLTANGKVDRKALPEPALAGVSSAVYVAPTNEAEEALATIWAEVLGKECIGINDNFFELGGHSLKAMALVAKVYKTFNVELPLREVFRNPVLQEMARYLSTAKVSIYADIAKVEHREYYPASSAQKRLFILNELGGVSTSYNVPGVMMIEGEFSRERFRQAIQGLIERHESLCTSFELRGGEVVQIVHDKIVIPIVEETLASEIASDKLQGLVESFIQPFDLSKAPLLRVNLFIMPGKYLLLFDMHHIISDGTSMAVLTEDFIRLYLGETLPDLKIQYKDFACWQQQLFQAEAMQKEEEYWLNLFAGELPVLNLPLDYKRPPVMTFTGKKYEFTIASDRIEELKNLALANGATLYIVLLAAYSLLLAKYSGQAEIVVGSPVAGRPHVDLEKILGMFVNTLPMRNHVEENEPFTKYLASVKENVFKAFENQDYQLEMLIDKLNLAKDLSRNPLFDTVFVLQNMDFAGVSTQNIRFSPVEFETKTTKFDLTLKAMEIPTGLHCTLEYNTALFKADTIERLAGHFHNLLTEIVHKPEALLTELSLLSKAEENRIINDFNATQADFPREKTIHQLFEEQVLLTPNKLAVVFSGKELTYRELNAKANQLGRILRAKGVKREQLVGIMAERSLEMVISVLAILKAGGAYLPIDPEYPLERVSYMLNDSSAQILLTDSKVDAMLVNLGERECASAAEAVATPSVPKTVENFAFAGITLNIENPELYTGETSNLENCNTATDLVHVIYTSGSTGKPKGVMIEHRNVARLIYNSNVLKIAPDERITQTGSLAFDASTFEIWTAFLMGVTLYPISKDDLLIADRFAARLQEYGITTLFLTSALFNQLLEENPAIFAPIKTFITGGDIVSPKHVNLLRAKYPALKVINAYGPTESTTFTTSFAVTSECPDNIPIGKPVSNTQVYILSKADKLQPIGIPGELCISGDGLGRGYLNQPDLTAAKFTRNPVIPGERMYRTGDLARWLPDGNIEFLGRIDGQVKIRGFRIELGEITACLTTHPEISDGVVIDRVDVTGHKYLAAYYVASRELPVNELKNHLAHELPAYMIPTSFVRLQTIPLTTNGKVDRRALPEAENTRTEGNYVAPRNSWEAKLAAIWSEVLGVAEISIYDNFFECGGHSLKAAKAIALMHKELQIEVSLRTFFQTPTIAGLAAVLQSGGMGNYHDIEPLPLQEYYELSMAQHRLWMIYQLNPNSPAYNLGGGISIKEKVDQALITQAFTKLIKRHESLRTTFQIVDGRPVQIIDPHGSFTLEYVDWSENSISEKELNTRYMQEFAKPFDLENGPLLRAKLVKLKADEYDLLYVLHHIITDGWSMEVLKREFGLIYEALKQGHGVELPPLKVQYKDFAAWQNILLKDPARMAKAHKFWEEELKGEISVLSLPRDFSPTGELNRESAGYRFVVPTAVQKSLKAIAKEENASLFMVLLSGFNLFLHHISAQNDILIGIPAAGRDHENLHNVMGYFINTMILRTRLEPEELFPDFLKRVQTNTLAALEYQSFPIELILDELKIKYPTISVFFNMVNMGNLDEQELTDSTPCHYSEVQDVKFDLVCYLREYKNGIEINCNYLKHLFKPETVEYMMNEYLRLLQSIATDPAQALKGYLTTPKQRKLKRN